MICLRRGRCYWELGDISMASDHLIDSSNESHGRALSKYNFGVKSFSNMRIFVTTYSVEVDFVSVKIVYNMFMNFVIRSRQGFVTSGVLGMGSENIM